MKIIENRNGILRSLIIDKIDKHGLISIELEEDLPGCLFSASMNITKLEAQQIIDHLQEQIKIPWLQK